MNSHSAASRRAASDIALAIGLFLIFFAASRFARDAFPMPGRPELLWIGAAIGLACAYRFGWRYEGRFSTSVGVLWFAVPYLLCQAVLQAGTSWELIAS